MKQTPPPTEAVAPTTAFPRPPLRARMAPVALFAVAALSLCALSWQAWLWRSYEARVEALQHESDVLDDRLTEARDTNNLLREQLEVLKHIEPAVPPTNDKLFTVTTKSIGIAEYEFKGTDSVTTTPEAAFTTDLTSTQRTDAYTQQATFHNTDTTAGNNLCVRPIAWSGVTTCNTLCANSTFTCANTAGSTMDGKWLQPGQEVTRDFDGTNCLCVIGSVVGGVKYQTERVTR